MKSEKFAWMLLRTILLQKRRREKNKFISTIGSSSLRTVVGLAVAIRGATSAVAVLQFPIGNVLLHCRRSFGRGGTAPSAGSRCDRMTEPVPRPRERPTRAARANRPPRHTPPPRKDSIWNKRFRYAKIDWGKPCDFRYNFKIFVGRNYSNLIVKETPFWISHFRSKTRESERRWEQVLGGLTPDRSP